MERKRSLMARNIARRARILCFNAVQEEKRAFFYRFLLHCVSSSCVSGRMHWSKRRNQSFVENIAGNWSEKEWKQNFEYLGVHCKSFANNFNLTSKDNILLGNPLPLNKGLPFAYGD